MLIAYDILGGEHLVFPSQEQDKEAYSYHF